MKITIQAGTNTYLVADKTIAVDGVGCYEGRLKNQPALVRALSRLGSAPLTLSLNIRNDDGFIPESVDIWAASVAIVTDAGYEWHGKITAYDSDGAGVLYASVTEKSAPELRIQIPDEVARVVTVDENFHQSAVNVTLPMAVGGNADNPIALKGILIDKTQGIYLMCVGEIRQFVSIRVGDADIPIAEAAAAGYATFVGTSGQTSYPGIAYVQITDSDKRKNDDGSYVEIGAKVVGLKLGTHTVEECRNGARFLYWLLKESVEGSWGLGVSEAEIDLIAFTEAIARVDAAGLKMDGVFYFRQPAQSWIDQICQAIRGSYEIGENGKRRLFVNADAASVKTYTKKNIKLLRKGKGNYVGRVFNKGKLDFDFNPITGLFMQSAFYENSSSIDDIGEQLFEGQSYLIRDMATAQAILDYTCQKSQIGAEKVLFNTTELPEDPRIGQIITFDYPEKALTGTWQITKLDISKNIHTVEAEKFASGIFVAGAAGTAIDWAYDPPVVSPVNPGQPSGLNLTPTIETNPDGTANVGISGTFNLPDGGYIGASVLWGEGDPPTAWNDHGLIQNGSFQLSPLKPGTKYYVKVRMVTTTGKSDYITGSVTTAGDTTPPGVPSIAVSTSLKRVTVNITLADPPNDMGAFWIYRNTVNDSGSATRVGSIACPVEAEGRATFSYEETASYSQELFFWARSVDRWKNPSGFSTAAGPINMSPLVYSDISNSLLKMPTGSKFRTSANGCTTASIAEVDGVKDVSFNGNHGQAVGGVSIVDTDLGKAFSFGAPGASIVLNTPIGADQPHTLMAWVNRSDDAATETYRTVFAVGTGNTHHMLIAPSWAVCIFDGSVRGFGYTLPDDGKMHRIVIVFNSSTSASLYADGSFINTIAINLNLNTYPVGRIGNWSAGTYFCDKIFDPRIYDRALSPSEIKSDYMLPQDAIFGQLIADYIGANAVRAKHMAIDEAVISVSAQIANAIINDAHIDSLSATKIRVGGRGAALNDDPAFQDSLAWEAMDGYESLNDFSLATISDGQVGTGVMRGPAGAAASAAVAQSRYIPIDRDKTYRLRILIRARGSTNGSNYVSVREYDNSKNNLSSNAGTYLVSNAQPGATWTEYTNTIGPSGNVSFKSGTAFVRIGGLIDYRTTSGNAGYEWQDLRLEEVIGDTLIQDGGITTPKLAAGAVTAEKLYAELAELGQLQVYGKNRCPDPAFRGVKATGLGGGATAVSAVTTVGDWTLTRNDWSGSGRTDFAFLQHRHDASSGVLYTGSNGIGLRSYHAYSIYSYMVSRKFSVKENIKYTFSFYATRTTADDAGVPRILGSIYWYDSSGAFITNNDVVNYVNASGQYVLSRFDGTAQSPSNAAFAVLRLYNIHPASASVIAPADLYFSAVQFEESQSFLNSDPTSWVNREQGTVTADRVVTGQMKSLNYVSMTSGSMFDLDNGTFEYAGGKLTYDGADLTTDGTIYARAGVIYNGVKVGFWDLTSDGLDYYERSSYWKIDSYYKKMLLRLYAEAHTINGLAGYGIFNVNAGQDITDTSYSGAICNIETYTTSNYGLTTNGKINGLGGFTSLSDEDCKTDIQDVMVLEKLKTVSVKRYKLDEVKIKRKLKEKEIERALKEENRIPIFEEPDQELIEDYNPDIRIGAMAASFNKAFSTNRESEDSVCINDQIGVALRAIQELAEIVDRQQEQIQQQNERIKQLEDMFKPSESAPDDGKIIITPLKGE